MGYFVQTTNNDITIKKEHFVKCYEAMCALNDRDDLKSGGSYGGDGVDARSPRPEGMDHHPAKWFAWMPADYPNGDLFAIYYDNKTGSEDHFFSAIAKYVEKDSVVDWRGEDGAEWRWLFDGVTLNVLTCVKRVWS
jgi:hypothetical protein